MAITKLSIFNGALRLLGEEKLSLITDDSPKRYYLDDAWDDGLIKSCLEQGFWNFATRTKELTYVASVEPAFGYKYAFQRPDDYVRLAAFCIDEYFNNTITEYSDEAGFWYCDYTVVYLQYISNDASYGGNYSLWSETFNEFVQAKLADKVKEQITGNDGKYDRIKSALKASRADARSKDAMNGPTKFTALGTWVGARMGSGSNNYRSDNV